MMIYVFNLIFVAVVADIFCFNIVRVISSICFAAYGWLIDFCFLLFVDIALYSHDEIQENEGFSYISPCEFFDIENILRDNKPKPAKRSKKEKDDKYKTGGRLIQV
jgi:hypothetical protein